MCECVCVSVCDVQPYVFGFLADESLCAQYYFEKIRIVCEMKNLAF